jgi:tRNA1Val (adenine37-N6)-methyltransferase
MPPGSAEPGEGETLDYICGNFRIFQYAKGHRYSTDDVLTAWYGMQCAPRLEQICDLGSGIGSVALIIAWRVPGARLVTVEAQEISIELARKTMRFNGLEDRVTLVHSDLRSFDTDERFDLVTGSPPYFPPGTASEAGHPQAIPARIEVRGSVADYAVAAARILAPAGLFAFVFPTLQIDRAEAAVADAGLALIRRRDVIFKEGEPPLISLFAASRAEDLPPSILKRGAFIEPPLVIRQSDGQISNEYAVVRMSFGFPPGTDPA